MDHPHRVFVLGRHYEYYPKDVLSEIAAHYGKRASKDDFVYLIIDLYHERLRMSIDRPRAEGILHSFMFGIVSPIILKVWDEIHSSRTMRLVS